MEVWESSHLCTTVQKRSKLCHGGYNRSGHDSECCNNKDSQVAKAKLGLR